MQGAPPPPNQPPGGGWPPGGYSPGGYPPQNSPYGYGQPPPNAGFGGPPGPMMSPYAPYGIEPVTGIPYSDKQKMVAGLLQLFLPSFAVGRFYTGHVTIAILQILASFTCVGILWPMIDGIMMLTGRVTDSQGRPLRDG